MIPIKFKQWNCLLVGAYYGNGRKAIELVDSETHEPIARATTNIPNVPLEDDEVLIKDYSENEGMADTLIAAGIIKPYTLNYVKSGFVHIHPFKLTVLSNELWKK